MYKSCKKQNHLSLFLNKHPTSVPSFAWRKTTTSLCPFTVSSQWRQAAMIWLSCCVSGSGHDWGGGELRWCGAGRPAQASEVNTTPTAHDVFPVPDSLVPQYNPFPNTPRPTPFPCISALMTWSVPSSPLPYIFTLMTWSIPSPPTSRLHPMSSALPVTYLFSLCPLITPVPSSSSPSFSALLSCDTSNFAMLLQCFRGDYMFPYKMLISC